MENNIVYPNKLVSVIIAAYNSEKTIDQCLNSIVNQTYTNIEIIICDDKSTDNTVNIVKSWLEKDNRIRLICNEKNYKAAYTRNICIRESKGEYIAIQDLDDYSDLNRLKMQVEILENEKNIDYVSTNIFKFNEETIWCEYSSKKEYPTNKDFLIKLPYVHPATMFRRHVLEEVGLYTVEKLTERCEDLDLFFKLHLKKFYGRNIRVGLYFYRENETGFDKRKYKFRLQECLVRIRGFRSLRLLPIGYIFSLKPLIIGLIPRRLQYLIKLKIKK